MYYIGLDVHKKTISFCVKDGAGHVYREGKIGSTRHELDAWIGTLRRTCARLCRSAGGELDQIQLLLGHVSIQTTEQYLGSRQRIRSAVNDRIGIEPES